MTDRSALGPDLVVVGAARSGTSFLAAQLSTHPNIDPPAVKEPNYFSREFHRGPDWYESLFGPRADDMLRLDASMSYTFPQFEEAIPRLAAAAPDAEVIYVVRDPVPRMLSHYLLHRVYFANEPSETFGAAISANPVYFGASDYDKWLKTLHLYFTPERLLVVPFEVVIAPDSMLVQLICERLALKRLEAPSSGAGAHRNDVVAFRSAMIRQLRRQVKRSGAYPWMRRRLGHDRLRHLRSALTHEVAKISLREALQTCSPEQLELLHDLTARASAAVIESLAAQDERLKLGWTSVWKAPDERPTE